MSRRATLSVRLLAVGATAAALALPTVGAAAGESATAVTAAGINAAPGSELTETTRLADRRSLVVGDRAYAMSTADSLYPAPAGTSAARWAGSGPRRSSSSTASGSGSPTSGSATRTAAAPPGRPPAGATPAPSFAKVDQVSVERTDFVPDGTRATLVGLTLTSPQPRTVPIAVDAHSELMSSYPWGWTTPNAGTFNLQDTGVVRPSGALLFREHGHAAGRQRVRARLGGPGRRHARRRARTSSARTTVARRTRPWSAPPTAPHRTTCDDGAFGKGTGGQLRWQVKLAPNKPTTLWFAVAGSDKGVDAARARAEQGAGRPRGGAGAEGRRPRSRSREHHGRPAR